MRRLILGLMIMVTGVTSQAMAQRYDNQPRYERWSPGVIYDSRSGRFYESRADGVFDPRFRYVPYSPTAERRTKIREGYLAARAHWKAGDSATACRLLREVIELDRKDKGSGVYAELEDDYCGPDSGVDRG
ncbi:hypothetical protein PQU92_08725 [Asticcacaulis sp. BYS171W]|uniref:Tetratricopeptide repeat protein n=1 Tax=Asticcacaulis aquaticus TaxID=2984212 RepID=A0ABT5HTG3_9CAUL|nr:hypothetical protein [Asticcacaulis aquaticus]MDC7683358.1 hypothetical protein [Asticcacaulis aquaticus]